MKTYYTRLWFPTEFDEEKGPVIYTWDWNDQQTNPEELRDDDFSEAMYLLLTFHEPKL